MEEINKKTHGVLLLVFLVFIAVNAAGCMGSAMLHKDPFPDGIPGVGLKDLPPLCDYPLTGQVRVDDGLPGIYQPGDIIQPEKNSPLYEPDIGLMIIRDTGDGRYEIGGVVSSGGTWYRLPGSNPGLVDHVSIERAFGMKTGHGEYGNLATPDDWRPDGYTQ